MAPVERVAELVARKLQGTHARRGVKVAGVDRQRLAKDVFGLVIEGRVVGFARLLQIGQAKLGQGVIVVGVRLRGASSYR